MRMNLKKENWSLKRMAKVWINTSDIILVGLRDYQPEDMGTPPASTGSLGWGAWHGADIPCFSRGNSAAKDNKADVILKYNADEARSLKAYGELPEHAKINETDTFGPGDDDEIQFDDIGDDDEDIDDI
ncbi:eukaryotic translation initiation factor 1A, Y-chromosomal isoform X4 [Myotis daubentonii]|uniref:eukaryotic translation initiation factor 1A, Y-chromosomal isoform X4 n=1 Tax=Myotis daubentonii TaxID=98922 RepID=UPI0028730058|nr:eukaryotic translation initiation factor 1A, Y-chromosomal isoform X4 [Myotis daubentonii]XP_059536620.1 eukaryotic translation initiation factor 1A, Y-chromosomal isoform X4 [Myotis daubentonii]